MSRRKKKQRSRPEPAAPAPAATPPETPAPGRWPDHFVSLRNAMLAAFCVAGWGFILAMLGQGNNLLGLKQACMILAGARFEPMLLLDAMHSMDIAAVVFAFILVLGAGYVHVSLGLAVLLAIRPWLDGYVYVVDNYYFLWAAMLLLAIWAVRQWARPVPVLGRVPLALLALFWAWSAVAAATGMQYDTAYREQLLWAYYGIVFFLAIQATPDRTTRGIVLTGFLAGMAGQAIYAYPYLFYLLPWMRQQMTASPELLAEHFGGITEATPEIARRFNVNRASASMVYPNALAALLILGLPGCLALAVNGWRRLRQPPDEAAPRVTGFRYLAPWGIALFSVLCLIVFLLGQLRLAYRPGTPAWFGGPDGLAIASVVLAAAVSVAFLLEGRRLGLARAGDGLGTIAVTLLFPVALGALWLTYSRGAMLALAAACVVGAWIVLRRAGGFKALRRGGAAGKAAAAGILCLAGLAIPLLVVGVAGLPGTATAQETPSAATDTSPTPSPNALTDEGIDLGLADLADPASLGLRMGYWRVSLAMARDNWITGVGPGNYKFAYPIYQYLGAGDVQNAHNGLLQAWCETGLFGALALAAFWLYLLGLGVRALHRATHPADLLLGQGLLVGLLAYLLHALLDMNLTHPTLVTFAMAAAGVYVSLLSGPPATGGSDGRRRTIAVALLVGAAVLSGLALRPYLQHLGMNGGKFVHVGDRAMVERRYNTASYFLADCARWARQGKQEQPPLHPIREVVTLLGEREQLFHLGRILARDPASGEVGQVPPGGYIPPDAVFQIRRPWDAHLIAFEKTRAWLAELERLDARAPYSPDNALSICNGYKLLVAQAGEHQRDQRDALRERMLAWGGEALRRAPRRADIHQFLGWVHWTAGTAHGGRESLQHFEEGLAAFERATRLVPNDPSYHSAHAQALRALGQAYQNAGDRQQAERYFEKADRAKAEAQRIYQRRGALGLD